MKCLYRLPKTYNFKKKDNAAEQLMSGRIPFERIATFAVFAEAGVLPPLIHQLKYHKKREIGHMLGRLFGEDLLNSDFLTPIDLIVPVPLHRKRYLSRGFNQAELIAKGISDVTSIPLSVGNLIRVIFNPTQTKRTKTERWENVKNIFKVRDCSLFEQKHLLLVDDVITTGSTLEACGIAMQQCKNIKISIATIGEVF